MERSIVVVAIQDFITFLCISEYRSHQDGLLQRAAVQGLVEEGCKDAFLDGGTQGRHAAEGQVGHVVIRIRRVSDAVDSIVAATGQMRD